MIENEAIPTEIIETFNRALELSMSHNTLFLPNICQDLQIPKSFFVDAVEKYESLEKVVELINTNLESNILRQAFLGATPSFCRFALEAIHGWKADGEGRESVKITVEGVDNNTLDDILSEDY